MNSKTTNAKTTNSKTTRLMTAALAVSLLAGTAFGSPAVDIRSIGAGPVTPGFGPAGPNIDPTTQQGQWFLMNNGLEDARSHEFHDNIDQFGGGAPDHLAIRGAFANYITSGGFVTGYRMNVSITNNTPATNGPFLSQPNTHGEDRLTPWPTYAGEMRNVRFVSHWADDGVALNFQQGSANIPSSNPGPTSTSPGTSNTFATGYDAVAWYSFNQPIAGTTVAGSYQVPAWDFGNIAVGQTVTRLLSFSFYQPLAATAVTPPSTLLNQDLLIARSNDVKIGAYFADDPLLNAVFDRPVPYPPSGFNPATSQYGNSSVFFDPIPAPGAGLVVAIAAMLGGRRRRGL